MPLKFTIQDYTSGSLVPTVIDEPVGLDKVTLHLSRDKNYHGFADMIEDSLGSLRFYGPAYTILSDAYHNYGVDARLECLIEFACDDTSTYQTLYTGRFSLDTYKSSEGNDGCYVECNINNSYNLTVFRDRIGQKVSLDSTACFDTGYPALPAYPGLGTQVAMQPMTIRLVNYATIDTNPIGSQLYGYTSPYFDYDTGFFEDMGYPSFGEPPSSYGGTDGGASNPTGNEFDLGGISNFVNVITPYANIRSQELGDFPGPVGDIYTNYDFSASAGNAVISSANSIFTFKPDIPYEDYYIDIDIELSMAVFNGRYTGHSDIQGTSIDVLLVKGLDWSDAKQALHAEYNLYQNDGSATDRDNSNNQLTFPHGCKIDQKEFTLPSTPSDITGSGSDSIGSQIVQYSFHSSELTHNKKGIIMQPGDQLFLLVRVGLPNVGAHMVFFSDTYTYQNTYQNNSLTPPLYIRKKTISTNDGFYQMPVVGGPTPSLQHSNSQALSYIRITYDSHYRATPAPVYMVGEALSRSAEIITNGQYQVYSDYFGRPIGSVVPSLPQPSAIQGGAALTALTNGLLIRGYSPLQAYYMGVSQNTLFPLNISSYTLDLSIIPSGSSGVIISVNNSTGSNIIIPASSPNFAIGTEFIVEQSTPEGIATITAASGVFLTAPGGSYTTSGIGSQILVTCIGIDTWLIASRASMFCSFKDIIDGMKSIHAVGFGIEPDPTRTGMERIRVEPISHFYDSTTTMLTCPNVDMVTTTVDAAECISEFDIGYSKWEAEEAQGLDEFLTKRSYRTGLNVLRTKRSEMCKFVASGYAIETTRRKLGTSTTDWRYDKDLFVLSLTDIHTPYKVDCNLGLFTNKGPQNYDLSSENGGFINSPGINVPTRIIDPDSVYNARISPVRNALRWLKYIFQCFVNPSVGSLLFMEGDGNYYATGQLSMDAIEAAPISENQSLHLSDAVGSHTPIWKAETVSFKYPLGYNEWLNIYNQKTGLVKYSVNEGSYRYGYIQDLKYNLFEGIGEFTLKTASI